MTDGTLERHGDRQVLHFERHLNHPVERVWRALTEPDQLAAWLALTELELTEGGRVVLSWQNTGPEGDSAVAHGTVTALDPPRLVEFDTDIHGRLRWELEPDGDGTTLKFSADAELPPDWELEVLAGWHIHLDHLAEVLDGGTIDWPNWSRDHMPEWQRLRERYAALP